MITNKIMKCKFQNLQYVKSALILHVFLFKLREKKCK